MTNCILCKTSDDTVYCQKCEFFFCEKHKTCDQKRACDFCDAVETCFSNLETCTICMNLHSCNNCIYHCNVCTEALCSECMYICEKCDNNVCKFDMDYSVCTDCSR